MTAATTAPPVVRDALAQEDARIRVFHQPNGGPAHARNTGLDNARGDYTSAWSIPMI